MKKLYFFMLTLSITLFSSLFLIYSNTLDLLTNQSDSKKILVYVKPNQILNDGSDLVRFLKKDRRVSHFTIQSKDEILSSFNETFPEYAQGLSLTSDVAAVIPQIIEITFEKLNDSKSLVTSLQTMAGVTEVQSQFSWLEKLQSLKAISLNFVMLLFGFFGFVLVVISILMAHKFVLNEKEKLQIYSFCGATQKQIFKVLFSSFYTVTLAGLFAGVCVTYLFYAFVKSKISVIDVDQLIVQRIQFLSFGEITLVVFSFALIVYTTMTVSAKFALKEVWNED